MNRTDEDDLRLTPTLTTKRPQSTAKGANISLQTTRSNNHLTNMVTVSSAQDMNIERPGA
jgi:hypothetical protein